MTIYLSGPMAGHDHLNEPAFRAAAKTLVEQGHPTVVPHDIQPADHPGDCPRSYAANAGGHSAACHLRGDLLIMLVCDEVAMLPGWEASVGARLELNVAAAVGLPVRFIEEAP